MSATDVPPEIPPPGPRPRHPHRLPDAPAPAPVVPPSTVFAIDEPASDARGALLRRRRVMLTGVLDEDASTRAAAELMMLDGESGDPVEVIVNSDGGPLLAVPAVLDVIDLMRAPVATCCIGRAMGTAAIVLASGRGGRSAAGHAMIGLRLRDQHDISGRASEIERFVEQLAHVRDRIVARLVQVTGLDEHAVAHELDEGAPMTAQTARTRGLIDEIVPR
jgi:ATP-dependent Clp protease protease subunit